MEVRGQLYAQAILSPRKKSSVPIKQITTWTSSQPESF